VLCRCYLRCGIVSAVKIGRTLAQTILRVLRPQPTVRWRLTLIYSVLFLICGAALLAITYWLFTRFTFGYYPPTPNLPLYGKPPNPAIVAFAKALSQQRSVDLHHLQVGYGVALASMALVSGVLAWLVAGRVLAPLRTITATAERISDTNLSERLAMPVRAMSCACSPIRSTGCWNAWRPRLTRNDGSSQTPRMSCAPRWR